MSLRNYRNSGETVLVVDGKEVPPGGEFRADLPEEQERQWLRGRHIQLVVKKKKADTKDEES